MRMAAAPPFPAAGEGAAKVPFDIYVFCVYSASWSDIIRGKETTIACRFPAETGEPWIRDGLFPEEPRLFRDPTPGGRKGTARAARPPARSVRCPCRGRPRGLL